jgi:hypothetical protein
MLTPPLELSYIPKATAHPLTTRDVNYICDYTATVDEHPVGGGWEVWGGGDDNCIISPFLHTVVFVVFLYSLI